ncbi:MAG: hypothetical protein ACREP8_07290 [Candidatus Binatia bacterium]
MARDGTVETTLGDLVAALTEETVRFVRDENEANILVAYMLTDLFSSPRQKFRGRH